MKTELTIPEELLGQLPEDLLLAAIGDLREYSHYANGAADAGYTAKFKDAVGDVWDLPCYLMVVGDRAIMWSCTDEAGIDDVTVVDAEDDWDEQIREYAKEMAAGLNLYS